MRLEDNDIPHIQAQCSTCGFLYDMKWGLSCPSCRGIGVKWARLVSEQEAQEYVSEDRKLLLHNTLMAHLNRLEDLANGVNLDPDATREITWCEKLFALDNEGSTR